MLSRDPLQAWMATQCLPGIREQQLVQSHIKFRATEANCINDNARKTGEGRSQDIQKRQHGEQGLGINDRIYSQPLQESLAEWLVKWPLSS